MQNVYLAIALAPLVAAIIAGLGGRLIGRVGAHSVTILGVALSFGLSAWVLKGQVVDGDPAYNAAVYTWLVTDGIQMQVGFLIDHLTALMMVVVTFVSASWCTSTRSATCTTTTATRGSSPTSRCSRSRC